MLRKTIKKIIPIFLVFSVCLGTSLAFLSASTNKLVNKFSIAYTGIEVREPSWNPDEIHVYDANETFAKDPQIYNSGNEAAYVYMSVFVPKVSTGYYTSYGGSYKEANSSGVNAYTYSPDDMYWSEILFEDTVPGTAEHNGKTYKGQWTFYAYRYPLSSKETTKPLFESMKFLNYDPDVENALEDDEKNGIGTGSNVLGKELPVIIQAYAATADVVDTMMSDYESNDEFWNCGPVMGWKYLVEELNKEYENEDDKPEFLSLKTLCCGSFAINIYDAENVYVEKIILNTVSQDYLDLNSFNSVLKQLGYAETFESEEEMYASFVGNVVISDCPIYVYDFYGILGDVDYCYVKDDLCKVHVVFTENDAVVDTLNLAFKEGAEITGELIVEKLAERNITVNLNDVQINETAVNGVDFILNVVLDSDTTTAQETE